MSQKIVTISMQNSEGNGFGDPWQILSSTFLKSSVFCYVELTLSTMDYAFTGSHGPGKRFAHDHNPDASRESGFLFDRCQACAGLSSTATRTRAPAARRRRLLGQ